MNNDFATKPRKQEEFYRWAFFVILTVYVFSILVGWIHMNPWVVAIGLLGLGVLLWYTSRPTPPWHYDDAIKACRQREKKFSGTGLAYTPDSCEVIEHANRWLVFFRHPTPVTYSVDPVRRVIIRRQIRHPDDIIAQTDRSDVLRTAGLAAARRKEEARVLDAAGIDTGEVEEDNDE